MTRPNTFERVYTAIEQRIRQGIYRPGDRLEPASMSEDLNASVTPVRDALHRLTGERLVDAPRHEGFRVPLLTEADLRHLYGWHRDLLSLALSGRRSANDSIFRSEITVGDDGTSKLEALLLAILRSRGNPEHVVASESLTKRLQPIQHFEGKLLDAIEDETNEILKAFQMQDLRRFRSALEQFYRRRERIVPQVIESLHSPT